MSVIRDEWRSKDGRIHLILGDCLSVLPTLEAGSFDAVVTDPPWKASATAMTHRRPGDGMGLAPCRESKSLKYGDIGFFSETALSECVRISRADVLVLCGYMELAEVISAVQPLRGVMVWHNTRPTPRPGSVKRRDVSFIVWGGIRTLTSNSNAWNSCLFAHASPQGGCLAQERILNRDGSTAHPAQEPLGLFFDIVEPLGDTVLDPYLGSGTTAIACIRTGRQFTGIEIEPKYFEIAKQRVKRELAQPPLPFAEPEPAMTQRELLT